MYLSIDIGTGSLKAALMKGTEYWIDQVPLSLTQEGLRAEQDPSLWLNALCTAVTRLLKRSNIAAEKLEAIALSSHSPSLVPVDKEGEALLPCLTWQDRRALDQAERLNQELGEFFDPSFFEPKILWIKEREPQIYARTKAFLQPKDFVIYHLTGEMIIDRAAARFSRANQVREIDLDKLPRQVNNWDIVGRTSNLSRRFGLVPGIPVVAGGIDAYCEALGAGLVEDGQFGEATGTSTCLSLCLDESKEAKGASAHVIPGRSLYIMPMSVGGGTLKWFLNTFGSDLDFAGIEHEVLQSPPGANGLIFLPYLSGERSPIWDEQAKGVFFGITSSHTRADFLRAVLEGTALATRHSIESLPGGLTPTIVRATGGGSRVDVWNQIKADVTGLPYQQLQITDGALLGGLLLAAFAAEKKPIADLVQENVAVKREFSPQGSSRIYAEIYDTYKKLYPATKELMR
jgi:xylulokinase